MALDVQPMYKQFNGNKMKSVMFVCLGNICRSPAGEWILRQMAEKAKIPVKVQSSGLGNWHLGQLPDERMRHAAASRGFHLTSRAQQFKPKYLDEYDYILAADQEVLQDLHKLAKTTEQKSKIHLMTTFSKTFQNQEVPDPYYEGMQAFELVLDMLEDSCQGLLKEIKK